MSPVGMVGPFEVPGYHVGDCRALLAQLPDDCIDCVVTSPPYWALRDYGSPPLVWGGDPCCAHRWGQPLTMHRGGPSGAGGLMLIGGRSIVEAHQAVKDVDSGAFCEGCVAWRGQLGLEPSPELFVEHLVGVLAEVRRVLRPAGTLWLNLGDSYAGSGRRNDEGFNERWHGKHYLGQKQAGTDQTRPTRPPSGLKPKDMVGIPWRVVFALQADGWWLRSDIIWAKPNPMPEPVTDRPTKAHEYLFLLAKGERYHYDAEAIRERVAGTAHSRGTGVNPKALVNAPGSKQDVSFSAAVAGLVEVRNRRSVWTIPTEPTPDAHFATFPRKLVEPCILAGCPVGGLVLDPFGGSGTVGRVAEDHGRRWLLFDLNPAYAEIAGRKTAQMGLLGRVAR